MGGTVPSNPSWTQASPLLPRFSKRNVRPARRPELPLLIRPGRRWQTAARRALLSVGGVQRGAGGVGEGLGRGAGECRGVREGCGRGVGGAWEAGLRRVGPWPRWSPAFSLCPHSSAPTIPWPGPVQKEQLCPCCCQSRPRGEAGRLQARGRRPPPDERAAVPPPRGHARCHHALGIPGD